MVLSARRQEKNYGGSFMRDYIEKITKLCERFAILLYSADIFINILYIFMLFFPSRLMEPSLVFQALYYTLSGVLIAIDVVLIMDLKKESSFFNRMQFLRFYIAVQSLIIIVDLIYSAVYGGFWIDMYVWISLEAVLILGYGYRYFFLKITQDALRKGGDSQ
jgi:hypothetical protein